MNLIDLALRNVWAMEPRWCERLSALVAADGIEQKQVLALFGSSTGDDRYDLKNGVAYIPITGALTKRQTYLWGMRVGRSLEAVRLHLRDALGARAVRRVVLDIDSPGGQADGIADLAAEIASARGKKPIVAYANGLMASAAYWLGSAASRIVASRDAVVGSLGVYAILEDHSLALAQQGVRKELIRAGRHKGLDHKDFPISADARSTTQATVDAFYGLMVRDIAGFRGWPIAGAKVLADGKVHIGGAALRLGLVDAIGTIETAAAVVSSEPARLERRAVVGVVEHGSYARKERKERSRWTWLFRNA